MCCRKVCARARWSELRWPQNAEWMRGRHVVACAIAMVRGRRLVDHSMAKRKCGVDIVPNGAATMVGWSYLGDWVRSELVWI